MKDVPSANFKKQHRAGRQAERPRDRGVEKRLGSVEGAKMGP